MLAHTTSQAGGGSFNTRWATVFGCWLWGELLLTRVEGGLIVGWQPASASSWRCLPLLGHPPAAPSRNLQQRVPHQLATVCPTVLRAPLPKPSAHPRHASGQCCGAHQGRGHSQAPRQRSPRAGWPCPHWVASLPPCLQAKKHSMRVLSSWTEPHFYARQGLSAPLSASRTCSAHFRGSASPFPAAALGGLTVVGTVGIAPAVAPIPPCIASLGSGSMWRERGAAGRAGAADTGAGHRHEWNATRQLLALPRARTGPTRVRSPRRPVGMPWRLAAQVW